MSSQLKETFNPDGTVTAEGRGVLIHYSTVDGAYICSTQASTKHSRRYYRWLTYEQALERAAHFHRTHSKD
jgi:hypothetical protein